jgi:tetratricopeptide (TPR) repeat protein
MNVRVAGVGILAARSACDLGLAFCSTPVNPPYSTMSQRMKMSKLLPLFVIAPALAATAFAQEAGDYAVVKADKAALRSKGPAATIGKGELLLVLKVDGDGFLVRLMQGRNEPIEGRINRADVLTLPQALAALDDELKRIPSAAAYVTRAAIWELKREYDKAIADCSEAIRLDPKQAKAYSIRGSGHYGKRQYDPALSDYTEAIRLDPKSSSAYARRAYAWRASGNSVKALADCDKAQEIYPASAPARATRAWVWAARGQHGLVISECTEAIRLDPHFAVAYSARGFSWLFRQEYAKAVADFDEAIRLVPSSPQPYIGRGMVREATEDFAQALADYDSAIQRGPNEYLPLGMRAWLTATCADPKYRDAKRSLKDAKKARELCAGKDWHCLVTLAAASAENADFLNAVKWQKEAIEMLPESDRQQIALLHSYLSLYQAQQPYHQTSRGG